MRGIHIGESKGRRFRWVLAVACATMCLVTGIHLNAQVTTADVLGTVTDNTGAVVPNAKVTITNTGTNESRSSQSNVEGDYVFTLLLPGRYSVRVEAKGFRAFASPVTLVAGARARIDAQLQVGSNTETVEVTATVPLLQTDSSTVTSTITDQHVQELPLATRNLTNLIELVPGANEASSISGLSSGQRPDDRRQSSSFSVHGHDEVLNNELVDGTDNNERIIGTIGVKPSIDAIQEVSVETNDYAAETGRTPGAVVNIITKSGTNKFHGSLFEFFQNNAFNARNPFDPKPNATTPISPQSELRQNDFGASLGGPIFKNKTFFFGAVEEFRQVAGVQNPIFSSVPTLAQEQAGPQAIVNADPQTAGLPLDRIAVQLFKLYPAPNTGAPGATTNNFLFDPNRQQYSTTVDGRIDHHFDDSNLLYVRYTLNNVSTDIPNNLPPVSINGQVINPGSGPFGFSGPAKDVAHNAQANYTHIFSSNLLLEAKAAYTRINNFSNIPNANSNAATVVGFPNNINFGPLATGLPLILPSAALAAFGDSRFIPLQALDNTFQYSGAVTYTHGLHTIKAGASLVRRQARSVQSDNPNGSYNFGLPADGSNPANVLATFLVGAFTSVNRSTALFSPDYRMWEPGFYVQDNWKVKRWLTVNYGFRYDVYTPFTEVHNHIANFDVATGQVLVAGVNGVSDTAGVQTDYSNFAPRIGFSASLGHGMVVRGGFALSYFPGNYTSNAALKNPPFVDSYNPNCASPLAITIGGAAGLPQSCALVAGAPTTLEQGIPVPTQVSISTPGLNYSAVQLNLKSGSVDQYNLIVEKQFGQNVVTVGFVGDAGHHLPLTLNNVNVPVPVLSPNPGGLGLLATFNSIAKPFPNVSGIQDYVSEGSSSYNSLVLTYTHRYSNGLSVGANYTWSHAIDDTTTLSMEGQEGWGNADPFAIHQLERSNGDLDLRHRFVVYGTYELPFGKNFSGVSKTLAGGWAVNALVAVNSGNPFTITDNFSNNNTVFPGSVGGPTPDRPLQIASASVSNQSIGEWFNRNAFVVPPGFTATGPNSGFSIIGNTPRNSLYGPGFHHLDLSLFKNFQMTERFNLQLRSEFFNITNTPSYFIANNQNNDATTNLVPLQGNAASPAFGQIVRTNPNYTPRTIQLALKLLF